MFKYLGRGTDSKFRGAQLLCEVKVDINSTGEVYMCFYPDLGSHEFLRGKVVESIEGIDCYCRLVDPGMESPVTILQCFSEVIVSTVACPVPVVLHTCHCNGEDGTTSDYLNFFRIQYNLAFKIKYLI